jgi:hypothetical protein
MKMLGMEDILHHRLLLEDMLKLDLHREYLDLHIDLILRLPQKEDIHVGMITYLLTDIPHIGTLCHLLNL